MNKHIMNSYGSVSLVSEAIYKLLRYMNFFPQPTDPDIADANVKLQLEEEQEEQPDTTNTG
jgi:hypothetical protein